MLSKTLSPGCQKGFKTLPLNNLPVLCDIKIEPLQGILPVVAISTYYISM